MFWSKGSAFVINIYSKKMASFFLEYSSGTESYGSETSNIVMLTKTRIKMKLNGFEKQNAIFISKLY